VSTGIKIKKNSYFDSVFLMQVAKGISNEPGIDQAIALMGTENNKTLLIKMGVKEKEIDSVSSNDVVIKLTWRSFPYREDMQPGRLEKPSKKV